MGLHPIEKNDLVLVYYAGHGKLSRLGRLCLAATNTSLDLLESTSIKVDEIKGFLDASPSRKKVLILDCCYSGAVGDAFTRGSVDDQLQLASRGRGTYIMTASTKIESAIEKDDHGVFSRYLVEGIKTGEADQDEDGFISVNELY